MGLVSTWLNGIGLRSVVPTFEAAGIVSPAHLADLDVSYFESLGVTDPDDRRKLFYLVQRIKLAVNNKKDSSAKSSSPTAVERVDAVVSKDFGTEYERGAENDDPKGDDNELVEEKKVETEPLRRSKRIVAKKKKTKKVSSIENDSGHPPLSPTRKKSSASAHKRSSKTERKTKEVIEISPPTSPLKPPKRSPPKRSPSKKEKAKSSTSSPPKRSAPKRTSSTSSKSSSKKGSLGSPPLSPTKRRAPKRTSSSSSMKGTLGSPPLSPTKRSPPKRSSSSASMKGSRASPPLSPTKRSPPKRSSSTSSRKGSRATSPSSPPKRSAPKRSSSTSSRKGSRATSPSSPLKPRKRSSSKKNVVSPPASPQRHASPPKSMSNIVKDRKEKGLSRTYSFSRKSSIPSASSAVDFSGEICHSPQRRHHPESKLQRYSATSSHAIPSQPLESSSSLTIPNDQDDEYLAPPADVTKLKPRRATMAGNFDALGNTFQSSRKNTQANGTLESVKGSIQSSTSAEVSNRRVGSGSIPRVATSRSSKSMGVSESAHLQQYQRNSNKRSSIAPTRNSRASISTSGTSTKTSQSVPSPSKSVFVQGGSGAPDSWGTKIGYLREDNEAEHELFRGENGDESQYHEYYDMRIKVIVRKRPMSNSESFSGGIDIIHPLDYGSYGKALVYQPKTRVDLTKEVDTVPFAFDNVFDETSTNIGIYNRSLRNLVEPFFEGQWATVFAYGQTGSGKTYTMMGSNITGINAGTAKMDESNLGLYYLAALDIFEMMKLPEYSHLNVRVSLFEIYGGKLFDLLNERKQIKCLEDSKGKVCFPGLTEHAVHAPEHVMHFIEQGSENRSTGTTSRNADSSRSHAVLQIKLVKSAGRKGTVEHGRFSFIDLAGNERGADTNNASKATRLEGAEINTSLLALKEVIRALATGGSMTHIPFRGSKLTQVLKDSFVGKNSRCCMVACISPDIGNCEQTLNTLRYADRVKERNPETGVLPKSCEQPIRISSLQTLGKTPSSKTTQHESVNHQKNYLDDISMGEEELSDSFDNVVRNGVLPKTSTVTGKHKAGQALVARHRSVMTRWLAMVKDEMKMVNQVDADREGLEEYILQLQNVQRAQIGFLSELRGSLQNYVSAAEGPQQTVAVQDFDDSFEDLRD